MEDKGLEDCERINCKGEIDEGIVRDGILEDVLEK